jgi:hypothetical protein
MRGVPKLDIYDGWKMILRGKGPFEGYQAPHDYYGAGLFFDVYEQVNDDVIVRHMWEQGNWKKDSRE